VNTSGEAVRGLVKNRVELAYIIGSSKVIKVGGKEKPYEMWQEGFAARKFPAREYGGSAARSPAHESRQLHRLANEVLRNFCKLAKQTERIRNYQKQVTVMIERCLGEFRINSISE